MDSFALVLVACGGTAMLALLLSVTKKWRYYFVPVPVLPPEVHHQDGMDRVVANLVGEGEAVAAGTPLMEVENWSATMQILAIGPGRISKIFFGPGTYVRLSDPFAIVVCDPEDGRSGTDASRLEVIRILRTKVGR